MPILQGNLPSSGSIVASFPPDNPKGEFLIKLNLADSSENIFNSGTNGTHMKSDTVLEILEYGIYCHRSIWRTTVNPTDSSALNIKDTALTETSSNIRDSLYFCSLLISVTSRETLTV